MCQKSAMVSGEVGGGKKRHRKKEEKKHSSLKMLATQIDRERDLCTSSEIPADLQNKGVCFYHTLRGSYGKTENTTSLDLGMAPFNHRRILCTKILHQRKMFHKKKKPFNFLH